MQRNREKTPEIQGRGLKYLVNPVRHDLQLLQPHLDDQEQRKTCHLWNNHVDGHHPSIETPLPRASGYHQ